MFNFYLKQHYAEKALVLLWIAVQVFLLIVIGVNTELEAVKYTDAALYLAKTGSFYEPKYIFYAVPIITIFFFNLIGLGHLGVVFFQIMLNGIATLFLYKLAKKVSVSNQVAQITCFLFILFFPLQSWNVYLYTESIFISLTILFTYLLFIFPPSSIKNVFISLPVLLLLVATRPFGLLFILPFILYAIIISKGRFKQVLLIVSILALTTFIFSLNYAFKGGGDMDAMKPFKEEHIICFLANPNPEQIKIVETNNPVYDIGYYIFHNPKHFGTLMYKRLFSFFNLTRPHYSSLHNIYLVLIMFPTYFFLIIAIIRKRKKLNHPIYTYLFILIFFYSIAVTFQCDDYHSRFTMPLYFIFFLLASIGLSSFQLKSSYNK